MSARDYQRFQMKALESVAQRWSIAFLEHITPDLNDVVRPNPENLSIEGPMVNCAHRDSVRHDRLSAIRVFLDMSCIEKFHVTKPT